MLSAEFTNLLCF